MGVESLQFKYPGNWVGRFSDSGMGTGNWVGRFFRDGDGFEYILPILDPNT